MAEPTQPDDDARTLAWAHGSAQVQRLGAMLGPVVFRAAGHADFSPLQVAPWADEPESAGLPGILRRLRGEWPCVRFGRTDRPPDLPPGWLPIEPGDAFGHGFGSHHEWQWLATNDPLTLSLAIDYPEASPVRRLARSVRAEPDAAALELTLHVDVRRPCTLPVALHPTLRLDAGRVALHIPHRGAGLTYPVAAEPGISRLACDVAFDNLQAVPLEGGGTLDLSRYPLPFDTEELLQLQAISGPVIADYLDAGWALQLDWNHALLPDLMLWVSHRGRTHAPWNGRHWALGIEPVNGPFDLGRIARPPLGHAIATRTGVALDPGHAFEVRARISAAPH